MEIIVQNKTERTIDSKKVSNIAKKVIEKELADTEIGSLNILLTDDAEITSINKQFRNKEESTDILSFGYGLEEEPIGDIVISLERISEQSQEFGNSFEEELLYITIHGVLHVLGYDHEGDDTEDEEIFLLQKKYFRELVKE
ncbi:MAG TPA: rRNA maturation RNase YbeY [Mesotoga infera]|jgi:probable rRNA maturation factor|nr:rRNA maturation RNase YbeY [Mesotoga sp.]NLI05790.1 rRNA maturation RNase YbeY [Thermotogaceae bacterium]HOI35015.1 rRNA maturation RNase YbeY [Mesotoga infera]HON29228.1 rRNA maturation RNase YbeY [Mesotoga infera]HPD39461.1 rRNA maturation RNase YbeY [Mesotoga infera]